MKTSFLACLAAASPLLLPVHAAAQPTGDLWEISSQMNVPGMPAGMGSQTQRVCQGDDPERAAAQDRDRQNCTIKDKKQSATRLTVTMVCPQGTMTIDQTYNAARTEFKGSMRMVSKDGEMTVNTTGRKVGACNVQEARRERDEKMAAMQRQVEAGAAQGAAAMKQQSDAQAKQCVAAVESMQYSGLGVHGHCHTRKGDRDCQALAQSMPEAAKTCGAQTAEFCRRFRTQEGFLKARGAENAAQMCGVTTASVKAAECPRAAQGGSLAFLGAYCPVEAKPLAMEHCAGRDYTSKLGGRYAAFCQNYLANADFERPPGAAPARPTPTSAPAAPSPAPATPAQAPQPADAIKEGLNQGLDKLRGIFGR